MKMKIVAKSFYHEDKNLVAASITCRENGLSHLVFGNQYSTGQEAEHLHQSRMAGHQISTVHKGCTSMAVSNCRHELE